MKDYNNLKNICKKKIKKISTLIKIYAICKNKRFIVFFFIFYVVNNCFISFFFFDISCFANIIDNHNRIFERHTKFLYTSQG